jgi:hypothetical protein
MRLPSVRGAATLSTNGGGVRAQSVRPDRSVSKVEGLTRW